MTNVHTLDFTYGPRLTCGVNACAGLDALLPPGPVLLVTDAGVRRLGLADAALAALTAAGRAVRVFDAVEADPSAATVHAATAAGRDAGVTAVVGLGGGSPMDVAKLAAYLLGSGDALADIYGVDQARGRRLPLVLIPTTAGTGSEATPIAIVTVDAPEKKGPEKKGPEKKGAEKKGVVAAALYADRAVLDAELTVGLPPAVTAATGLDAMVHAIEAYTSARLKNPLSDMLARQALGLLAAHLRTAVHDGADRPAREAMLLGAHLAGVAFANAPVGGVHALAYPLGGHFHVPHGLSNALMLLAVMRHNLPVAGPLYAELAPLVVPELASRPPAARTEGLLAGLAALIDDCRLPRRLRDVGVGEADLDRLAADALKQQRLLVNNPVPITLADARRLYAEVL